MPAEHAIEPITRWTGAHQGACFTSRLIEAKVGCNRCARQLRRSAASRIDKVCDVGDEILPVYGGETVTRKVARSLGMIILIVFTGCSDTGKLTKERVQAALNEWAKGGRVTVVGIQESPSENSAVATLDVYHLTHAPYSRQGSDVPNTWYSGGVEAKLVHYNDGRWVVTELSSLPSHQLRWDSLNVEVK